MKIYKFTTLSLVFSALLLTSSANQCGNQGVGGPCPEGLCCSKWGWCGDTDDYCAPGNCQSQCPALSNLTTSPGQCGVQGGGALCPEGLCCSCYGWCGITDAYCAPGNCQMQCPTPSPPPPPPAPSPPGPPPPPPSGPLVDVISNSMYDELLKNRNNHACEGKDNFYSYDAFITAAGSFPGFGTTGNITIRKREIAAFLAQTSHETSGQPGAPYTWGYCYIREVARGDYCTESIQWPCVPGKQYYGRGPIQLSHNYNYGPCGRDLGLDLLNNPDLVATDSLISFKSAIWFWMTPQSPKPSCHDVITGLWKPSAADIEANRLPGYGVITNIINGGLECGHGIDSSVQNRIGYYKRYCEILEVSPGDNLDCGNQRPFGNGLLLATV